MNKILVFKTRHTAKYCQNCVFQGVIIFISNGTKLFPAEQCSHNFNELLFNESYNKMINSTHAKAFGCMLLIKQFN